MTLQETEQGRMSLWDKCLTAALNTGKDIHEALSWAEAGTKAFEDRFHKVVTEVEHVVVNHIA